MQNERENELSYRKQTSWSNNFHGNCILNTQWKKKPHIPAWIQNKNEKHVIEND